MEPEGDPREALKKGRLTFTLDGDEAARPLAPGQDRAAGQARRAWLLFKGRDDAASETRDIVAERPESVLTGPHPRGGRRRADRVWHRTARRADRRRSGRERRVGRARAELGRARREPPSDVARWSRSCRSASS